MLNLLTRSLKESHRIAPTVRHFFLLLCTAFLVACGGGGGSASPATVDTTLATTPIQSPSSTTNGFRNSGVLNIDIFVPPYGKVLGSTTVAYSSSQGTVSLANGLTTLTVNPTGYTSYNGPIVAVGLDGNAVLHCSSAAVTAGRALMSSNLVPVSSLNELKGRSFVVKYCESILTTLPNLIFNADGSASFGAFNISQSEILSNFSSTGTGFGTPDATRWRAYKALVNGQYLYAILDEGVDGSSNYVGLFIQN
jgi:hypothetical protein